MIKTNRSGSLKTFFLQKTPLIFKWGLFLCNHSRLELNADIQTCTASFAAEAL